MHCQPTSARDAKFSTQLYPRARISYRLVKLSKQIEALKLSRWQISGLRFTGLAKCNNKIGPLGAWNQQAGAGICSVRETPAWKKHWTTSSGWCTRCQVGAEAFLSLLCIPLPSPVPAVPCPSAHSLAVKFQDVPSELKQKCQNHSVERHKITQKLHNSTSIFKNHNTHHIHSP